jgi:hypothetical protein
MEPYRIDLRLSEISPNLIGGNPAALIANIRNNTYKFLIGTLEASQSVVLQFNDSINNNSVGESKYLDYGSFTAVFAVNCINNTTTIPLSMTEVLILRLVNYDPDSDKVEKLVTKYKEDKRLVPENMIDIYAYGNVLEAIGTGIVGQYVLTKTYLNHNDIMNFSYKQKLKLFTDLIRLLDKLKQKEYFYRDLKFSNIGAEIRADEIRFIILDYDPITILTRENSFFNAPGRCDHYCAGTLAPYYLVSDFYKGSQDWLNRYDKIYSKALSEIILILFFRNDESFKLTLGILYDVDYHSTKSLIENDNPYSRLLTALSNVNPIYDEIDSHQKNVLIALMKNLLHREYQQILLPRDILTVMETTFFKQPLTYRIIIPINNNTTFVITPPVTLPAVTPPAVTLPSVTPPAVTLPAVTQPAVTPPAVTLPAVTPPAVTLPAVTQPAVTLPAVTQPAVTPPPNEQDYNYKYLKYKKKYLELKKMKNT